MSADHDIVVLTRQGCRFCLKNTYILVISVVAKYSKKKGIIDKNVEKQGAKDRALRHTC